MSKSRVAERSAAYALQAVIEPAFGASFDLLATAPQGVAKLRELILSLAVRGKLVSQVSADEPASALLNRIDARYEVLLANGDAKRGTPLPEISRDELPFVIPGSWTWARLGRLTNFGSTEKAGEISAETWVLDLEDIEKDTSRLNCRATYAERGSLSAKNIFHSGDVLYGKLRPYLNKVIVADQSGVCTTEILPIRCFGPYEPNYFRIALQSPNFLEYVNSKSYGMKMPRLGTEDGRRALIPLPPLAEQARIVARVEELMQLCDALEANERLQNEQHARLVATLFDAFAASASAEALADNWQRIATHFDLLLDRPEAVDAFEQTLLQLAVRGLLVEQDATDEPANEMLARVRAEKHRLVAAGKLTREKPLPPIGDGEQPFNVPKNWCWSRIETLCEVVVDCPHSTAKFVASGVLCVDTNSFKSWRLIPHKLRYVTEQTFNERVARLVPRSGDLVFAREGSVGESVLIPEATRCCLGQRVMLFRFSATVLNVYIQMAISSKDFLDRLLALHKGIGAKHVNVSDMRLSLIPLPPLAEQHRIVARVEQLRRLCADLRERLQHARATQSRLADALVSAAARSPSC